MFGLLKKKISSFIDTLTQKEQEKPDEPEMAGQGKKTQHPTSLVPAARQPDASRPTASETAHTRPPQPTPISPKGGSSKPEPRQPKAEPAPTPSPIEPKDMPQARPQTQITVEKPEGIIASVKDALFPSKPAPSNPVEPTVIAKPVQPQSTPEAKPKSTATSDEPKTQPVRSAVLTSAEKPTPLPAIRTAETKPATLPQEPKERKLEAKIGLVSQIKGIFTREVQIQPSELEPMLDELNMALLESDVTLDTAEHIVATIKNQLAGRKVDKSRVQAEIHAAVKTALVEVLDKPPLDLVEFIRSHEDQKPVKILLLGPNGAGKTTTLAKIAHYLKQNNIRCVLAAADTFRAAAIEQLQHHGSAIGVPVIKHQYGADPAAVAFDAIAHAKAHGLEVVLIDTAGRQETNLNLLKEMEKINRVVKPDLKLFIGEAVAGHALVEQAKTFHQSLKLDGVILTKVDCDAKGGTSFSVSHEVGVPIVLLGTGQAYGDIRPFDAGWLVSNVLAE